MRGPFCRQLASPEFGLDIEEILHNAWNQSYKPNTFADGTKPIDGVWASYSFEIGGFKILPFGESVGDHSTMIIDISSRSLIGASEHRIVRPACRRLNCKMSSLGQYNKLLEKLMDIHKMEEWLDAIINAIVDNRPTPAQKCQMNSLDIQMVELQKCAEQRC